MNNNSKWYIKHELGPAIEWADSKDGKEWICKNFATLQDLLYDKRNMILGYEYVVKYLNTPIYCGEALKPARLLVHLWHLYYKPECYFGVNSNDILLGQVTISILETGILDKAEREKIELELRRRLCPVINPENYGNRCIPKKDRYPRVHVWYNNDIKLGKAIDILVYKCPFAFGWNEVLRKTPCFDYNNTDFPYAFSERIETFIDTIDTSDYIDLNRTVAHHIGNGFWVSKIVLVKVLSRILFDFDSEEEVLKAGLIAADMQIKIRQEFIKSVVYFE